MKTIRWGILGTGHIARKFAADLTLVADAELLAVGSRSQAGANDFNTAIPVKFAYPSYEELVKNPEIDVIYIATPHSEHYHHTMLCLHHNKAVLCEKPFSINARQALEMIALAQEKKVFLMEAMWTKFHPHFIKIKQMVSQGHLGEIKSVLVNFGFKPAEPVNNRLFDPELGGGTVLDIGIYNVFMALSILGRPDQIRAAMTPAATGVDEQCSILFTYKNGAMAQLFTSFTTNLAIEADICGTKGRIRLTNRFFEPSTTIELYSGWADSKQVIEVTKEPGAGYQYEARHVNDCLKRGLTESDVLTFVETIQMMEVLDEIRTSAGISYPADAF